MAKQLLLNSISSLLGGYIDGLTKENLRSSVWTGEVEFRNLKFKKDFIRKLFNNAAYYIDVKESSVCKVKVVIPWTKLATAPTILTIDTIDIILEPSAYYTDEGSGSIDKDLAVLKAQIIKEAERLLASRLSRNFLSSSSGDDSSSQDNSLDIFTNLFSQMNALKSTPLLLKIISNMSVVVTNVSVRYVDSLTNPAKTAVFGFSVPELSVKMSPDSQVIEPSDADGVFGADGESKSITNRRNSVSSSSSNNSGTLEGQIIISGLQVYCSAVNCGSDWREAARECILHPVDVCAALQRPADKEGNFMIASTVSSTPLKIVLQKEHMQLFCDSVDYHQRMHRFRHLRLFRPTVSARLDPRRWWQYALLLLTGNENYVFYYKHTLDQMNSCRGAYRDLLDEFYELQYACACANEDKGLMKNIISMTDDLASKLSSSKQSNRRQIDERRQGVARELEALEAQLPVQVLVMCRQAALTRLFEGRVVSEAAALLFVKMCDDGASPARAVGAGAGSAAAKGGEGGSLPGDEEGVSSDDLRLTFETVNSSAKSSLSIALQRTHISLLLMTGAQPLVEYSLTLNASMKVSEGCDVGVAGALRDVLVHDCMSSDSPADRPVVIYFDPEVAESKDDGFDAITFSYSYNPSAAAAAAASLQERPVSKCVVGAKRLVFQSSSRLLYHYSDFVLSPMFSWFILCTNGAASDHVSTRSVARRGRAAAAPPRTSVAKMIRDMLLEIDARGPLVILPHDSPENGFMVVDFDRLFFHGLAVDLTKGFNSLSILTPNVGFYFPLTIGDISASEYKVCRLFDKPVTIALRGYATSRDGEVLADRLAESHRHLSRSLGECFPRDLAENMLAECSFAAHCRPAPVDSLLIDEGFSAVEMRAFSSDLSLRPTTIHRLVKMATFLCSVGDSVYSVYLKAAHVSEGEYRSTNNNLHTRYNYDAVNAKVFEADRAWAVGLSLGRLGAVTSRSLAALRSNAEEEEEEEEDIAAGIAPMDLDELLLSYVNGGGEEHEPFVFAAAPGASQRIDSHLPTMTFSFGGHLLIRLMLDDEAVAGSSPKSSPGPSSRSGAGDDFSLVMELSDIAISTRERALDLEARLLLGTLRVYEEVRFSVYSLRAAEVQQNVLLRSHGDCSAPFLELEHTSVSSAASPLYAFYGGALSITLQAVSLVLNAAAIYNLKGMLSAVTSVDCSALRARPGGREGERLFVVDHSVKYYSQAIFATPCSGSDICFAYAGTLRPKHFWHSYLTKELAPRSMRVQVRSMEIEVTNTIVDDPTYLSGHRQSSAFNSDEEEVFRVVLAGIEASLSTGESQSAIAMLSDIKLTVRDFEMQDTREMSRDWHFKTLMRSVSPEDALLYRPPQARQQARGQARPHAPPGGSRAKCSADSKHWWMDTAPPADANDNASAAPSSQEAFGATAAEDRPFFEVVLSQERVGLHRLDVMVNNLLSCCSLDALKDVSNTSLAVLHAFMCVFNLAGDGNERHSPALSRAAKPKSSYTLSVQMPNPCMLVLDDPSVASSRAFLLVCEVDAQFSLEQWKGQLLESQEALHLTAQAVEVHSVAHASLWLRATPQERTTAQLQQRIVSPASIDFHFTRNLERLVVLSANVSMNMSHLDIDVSLENLALLQSVLFRMTLSSLKPARIVDTTRYCLLGAQRSDGGTQVDIYSLALHMGRFRVNAVDDTGRSPIIQAILKSAIFSVSGALHPKIMVDNVSVYLQLDVHHIEGCGQLALQVDFYNPTLRMSEPIVEPFTLDVAVRKDYRGLDVNIECGTAVQLNLSGQMLQTTLKQYEAYRRKVDEGIRRGGATRGVLPPQGQGAGGLSLTVYNRLLFEISYKFETTEGTELATLPLGGRQTVSIAERFQSKLLLAQLGLDMLGWSAAKAIADKTAEYRFDFFSSEKSGVALTVLLRVVKRSDTSYECILFTSGAFLDKTGMGFCIKGYRKGKGVVRQSCSSVPSDLLLAMQGEQWVHEHSTAAPLVASALVVQSKRNYLLVTESAGVGECVYSDRHNIVWANLPKFMIGQSWLLTANDDFAARTSDLVRFSVNKPCVVLLLFPASNIAAAGRAPHWLLGCGFIRTMNTAIARDIFTDHDSHYVVFGKPVCEGGSELCLGGVEPVGYSGSMYSVCIVDPHRLQRPPPPQPPRQRSLQLLYPFVGRILADAQMYHQAALGDSWLQGKGGVTMFFSDDRRAKVGFSAEHGGSAAWSEALSLDLRSTSSQSGTLEVARADKCYQLYYSVRALPGMFSDTALVTLMPRFCILNCMDERLSFRQYGSEEGLLSIEPYQFCPWHKSSAKLGSKIQLRSRSSQWSYGGFDINEVGASAFLLPSAHWFSGSSNHDAVIVHVEVKLAEAHECCAAVAVIWKASRPQQATICVKNDSTVPITLNQANLLDESARPQARAEQAQVLSRYCLCVPPGGLNSYGWADPSTSEQPQLTVTVGLPPFGPHHSSRTVGLLRLYDVVRMPVNPADARDEDDEERDNSDPYPGGEVFMSIQPLGSGKVIRVVHKVAELGSSVKTGSSPNSSLGPSGITTGAIVTGAVISSLVLGPFAAMLLAGGAVYAVHTSHDIQQRRAEQAISANIESKAKQLSRSNPDASDEGEAEESRALLNIYSIALSVKLRAVCVSLTVERPVRREFLSIHLDSCAAKTSTNGLSKSLELLVQDFQLDSFSDTSIAPVVVHAVRDASSAESPVMQVVVVEETSGSGSATPHFKYIAARLLELRIIVDSASLKLFFIDLGCDFSLMSPQAMLAVEDPAQWAQEFVRGATLAERSTFVDVHRSQSTAQAPRVYIENLILHPVKITVTFLQTALPTKIDDCSHAFVRGLLSHIPSFVSLDGATIKLNSFIVHDAMESSEAIYSRIIANAINDLQNQIGRLAGSLTAIGRPVGLAKNVGGGVQAFFYEPYRGAMRSPSSFVAGIGRGAGRLVRELVGGALNSTAAIVSSASHSLSQSVVYVSGDEEFAMKRARKTQKAATAARAGVMSGLLEGGGSFVSGFATGVSGIVTDPISGAINTGLGGFIQGVGSGIMGVAVKPVLGISDGLNSVAQTIYYQNSDLKNLRVIRPQRTYDCVYINNATSAHLQLLTPIDLFAIEAQAFLRRFASVKRGGEEDFFCGFLSLVRDGESPMRSSIVLSNKHLCWRQFVSKFKVVADGPDGPAAGLEEVVEEDVLLMPWADISHCVYSRGEETVDVLTETDIFTVGCSSVFRAELLFHLLLKNSYRMKNPHYMLSMGTPPAPQLPPEDGGEGAPVNVHMLMTGLALEYKFGSENIRYSKGYICDDSNPRVRTLKAKTGAKAAVRADPTNRIIEWFEGAVLAIVAGFAALPASPSYSAAYDLYRRLDAAMFRLVYDWFLSHQGYDRSICGVFCIINGLLWPVQLATIELLAGNGCVLVPGPNYRCLQPLSLLVTVMRAVTILASRAACCSPGAWSSSSRGA